MKNLLFLFMSFPVFFNAQQTYVPDNNFEAFLEINGMGNGVFDDDSVTTANINTVTHLDISGGAGTAVGIFDLTGIEDFTALTYLSCYYNNIMFLDISNNTFLDTLICFSNQLTSLDVSNNTSLIYLSCYYNQLSCLDLKNGNNMNMELFAISNPILSCIEVDDPAWSTTNWTAANSNIDTGVTFNTNCNYPLGCFYIPTIIKENISNISLFPNPTDGLINLNVKGYNGTINTQVYDLSGRLLQTTNNTTISLKDYANGIYIFKVEYGDRVEELKVVKD